MAMRARRVLNWHTSWDELKVEGDLPVSRRACALRQRGRLLAVATVERDMSALEEERAWEIAGGPHTVA